MLYRKEIYDTLKIKETSEDIISLFMKSTKQFIFNNNQFVKINYIENQELYSLYREYIENINNLLSRPINSHEITPKMNEILYIHFLNHKNYIEKIISKQGKDIFRKTICSEYSPELQLNILGIDISNLVSPILDIGCGLTGGLVRYLSNHGFTNVFGIDRLVYTNEKLIECDWFNYDFKKNQWGTIISHMSFSNHFIYNHFYKNGNPESYIRKFLEILDSIKIGGSFFYTPDLPFIEYLLPKSKFDIFKKPVNISNIGTYNKFQKETYSVKITKK